MMGLKAGELRRHLEGIEQGWGNTTQNHFIYLFRSSIAPGGKIHSPF
jgi:hypothetical protein